ncbi:uncharacterized protein LOC119091603 [Pollicipes pollicipes]|uniref:uncharacterized protein LOC119091603 n=1 Tax=Pollicipes pollicipes TaxID=41117 RepID=UPI00188513D2|nr:uncharacterized protein LOC119091603 [Pollicipes pollicipes]
MFEVSRERPKPCNNSGSSSDECKGGDDEVANFLQLDLSQSQLLSISEQSPGEASFVLCHLINTALREEIPVCVFALDKPPSHYRHMCGKCGGSVRQAESTGSLTFVDGAEMALQVLRSECGPPAERERTLRLKALFEQLVEVAGVRPGRGLLLLDGLSPLLGLGASVSEVLLLVHHLLAWSRRRGGPMVTLALVLLAW